MARSAITVRLHSEERSALDTLSEAEGRPVSQLLNEAVRIYLRYRGLKERTLDESLDRLRVYRERDPDFRKAIASYGPTEATAGDPLSETVIRGPQTGSEALQGPVQTRIHELLRA